MESLTAWFTKVRSLLAPSMLHCLICGKTSRPAASLPGICAGCEEAIPWIRRPRCQKCGRHVGCPDCSRSGEAVPIVCNRSAVAYTSVMREILGQYKYRGNEQLAPLLGLMLDRAYIQLTAERERGQQGIAENQSTQRTIKSSFFLSKQSASNSRWQADLLVPVPVSESRLAERGFNQAERLADVLSGRRGIPQLPLLVRTHHTGKQSFKHRAERIADMKHAFAVNPDVVALLQFENWLETLGKRTRPLKIVIVDDIYTTGSTIRACAETIRTLCNGYGKVAEIYSLTWARS
ncbi:DNA utilization protein GntX [compost metagenome]